MSRSRSRRSRRASVSRRRQRSLGYLSDATKALNAPERLEARILLASDLPAIGQTPLAFEVNVGQADGQYDFVGRGQGYNVSVSAHELLLALNKPMDFGELPEQDADGQFIGLEQEPEPSPAPAPPTQLQIDLLGANSQAIGVGLDALSSTSNYYLGGDDGGWHTNVAQFADVQYTDVYSGIDVIYRGNEGNLQYDFLIDPGADPNSIVLAFENSSRLQVDGDGNLLVELEDGQVIQHAPVIFQDIDGERQYIDGGYVLLTDDQVAFEVGSYDASETLVIDPVLTYSSFLGGTGTDIGMGIGRDAAGNIYLTGYTNSTDFASTNGSANAGSYDVFVTKLSPAGDQILYSTYLGGTGDDRGWSLAADSAGNVYLTGRTGSADFPTSSGAAQANFAGGSWDAFVTKLDTNGSLLYSTFVGGSANENDSPLLGYNLRSIGVDDDGSAWITGITQSTNFPMESAAQSTFGGGNRDAFVTRLAPDGKSFEYSTFLGGTSDDRAQALVVAAGNAYVTGFTNSNDFPTSNGALQTNRAGGWDNFVTKLDGNFSGSSSLAYSTYLGGTSDDYGQAIAVDTAGHAYVTGLTWSGGRNFPTRNAFQGDTSWSWDGFVTKLNLDATDIEYSTFLAGKGDDRPQAITVDADGNAYVAGFTHAAQGNAHFPLVNPIQDVHAGGYWDGFITKLRADGGDAYYSTYLGGTGDDRVNDVLVDSNGTVYLAGMTRSADFRTLDPVQGSQSGDWDAFVTVLEDDAQRAPKLNPIPDLAIIPGEDVLVIPEVSDPDGPVTVGPTAAYSTPAGASGNQAFNGSVGMDFDVLAPIEVTHLGVFDDGSDGLQVPLTAHLYDRDNPTTPLATIEFAAGTTGTLSGGTRYVELAPNEKLTLPAGFRGTIVAEGYQSSERYGDGFSYERFGTTQDGGGHVAFVGTGRTGNSGAFPNSVSGGRTNRFGAGSFIFQGLSTDTLAFSAQGLPAGATLNPSTGEIQWTTAATDPIGSYTIELTATDDTALTATQTFSLHVVQTPGAPSSPLIVTNTADSGPGSLREAMTNALSIGGSDTVLIEFNIPTTDPNYQDPLAGGTGAFHINLTSTLPTLTRGKVTIDGWSQTGFTGDTNPLGPEIVINGDGIGFDAPMVGQGDAGVTLASSENVIRGLNIQGVPHYGIWINGGNGNVIQGNYVGTDETGSFAIGQARGINITGGASNNLIGTDGDGNNDDDEGNLLSGANERGVDIRGAGTQYNVVAGNIIGLNAAGDAGLENAIDGVIIYNNANYNLIGTNGSNDAFNENERNVISGNLGQGVRVQTAHYNQVSGNYIGPDPTGMLDLGNNSDGVQIRSGSTFNVVGTNGNGDTGDAFEWNLISGNNAFGVRIQDTDSNNNTVAGNWVGLNAAGDDTITNGSAGIVITNNAQYNLVGTNADGTSDPLERNIASGNYTDGLLITNAHFNELVGNWIGTDSTGTAALGNRLSGIAIYGGAHDNRIGTDGNGVRDNLEGNLVAASGTWGVYLGNDNTDNNLIAGNIVGTDATLTEDWGSGNDGLRLFGGAENNQIGGPDLMGNVFANSGRDGIVVLGTATLGNPIRGNSIFGSRQLGIDINNDGVTSNDLNDADAGPSGFLNFPVLESVEILGGNLIVTGFARPNSEIDLFIAAPDVTGFGEGKTFLTTVSESSELDGDDATGAYSYPLVGSDNTNRFAFTLPLTSLPATIEDGTAITATATLGGNTSEFSRSLSIKTAGNAAPQIISLNAPTTGQEGSFVDISGSYTDVDAIDGHIVSVDWGDGTTTTIEQVGPTANVTDLIEYNGHWYAVILDNLKFYDAEAQAQAMGGHLVTVNDQAENDFITQLIFDTLGNNRTTWVGLNDAEEEGVLTWVSGETSTYRNFLSGFADNWNGAAGQDFVVTNHVNPGTWDDRDGNNQAAAVVELTGERLFNASHVYDDDGNYTITVTVEDNVPLSPASDAETAPVNVANVVPVVTFSGSTSVDEGSTYVLTLAAADPGDDTVASWTVDWGDNTTSTVPGDTTSVEHTFANGDAIRNISVRATDEDGTYDVNVLGDLLVPSFNTNQVLRYDAITGEYIGEFASGPTQNGPVQNELGPDGRIYSTAWFSGDVVKLDATTGDFLDTVAYVREGNVRRPYGVTFGPDQLLYIASFERNEVQRFDPQTGEFLDLFISSGRGGLGGPTELLFDSAGDLLVASWNNNTVKKYDGTTGNYLGDFVGSGSGGLNGPDDMLFGPDGNFYIASRLSNSVFRYDGSTGSFIDAFVPAGTQGLSAPTGLLFDTEGNLLVSDSDNDRVLRFDGQSGAFIDEFIAAGDNGLDRPFHLTLIPSVATELTVNVANVAPEITTLTLIPAGSNNLEAPSEIDENGKVELTVDFSDPGTEPHEISVDWLDGTPQQDVTVPAGIETLTLTHQYLNDGVYSIAVTVTDSVGATDSETGDLTVYNVAPVLNDDFNLDRDSIGENEQVILTGSFSDVGTLDTHTIVVQWGDGTSSDATVNQVDRTYQATHRYLDDGPNPGEAESYVYDIIVTARDDDEDSLPADAASVTVTNSAPALDSDLLSLDKTTINEGESVTVSGVFRDKGLVDTHTVMVYWGDGTSVSAAVTPYAETQAEDDWFFTATRDYEDDEPTQTPFDSYNVTVVVTDDDGGNTLETTAGLVLVNNVLPSNLNLTLSEGGNSVVTTTEGSTVTLRGTFVDAGQNDTHTVTIKWGDGSSETFLVDEGYLDFVAGGYLFELERQHQYADDSSTPYTIEVFVADDDEPLKPTQASIDLTVENVIPNAINLQLDTDTIDEGDTVSLSGSFVDPGVLDTHRVVINWGDATPNDIVELAAGITSFAAISHEYSDDRPSGTSSDDYVVTVTITDNDFVADLLVTSVVDDQVLRFDGATGASRGPFIFDDPATGGVDESGGLNSPAAMIVGPDSNVYVTSSATPGVIRFNGTTGELLDNTPFIAAGGGLTNPQALAFGPGGALFVASDSNEILRYDGATGVLLEVIVSDDPGTAVDETGGLDGPTGILFGPNGNLLVSSFNSDQVLKYDRTTGEFLGVLVQSGSGGLDGPRGLAINSKGRLVVASSENDTLLTFNATNGKHLGNYELSTGLHAPAGLGIDAIGNLYATSDSNEVLRFDQDGNFLDTFVPSGDVANPTAVAFVSHQASARESVTINNVDPVILATDIELAGVGAFNNLDQFLQATGATATATLEDLGLISGDANATYTTTDNALTVSLGPNASELLVGAAGVTGVTDSDWTTRLAGAEITTTGKSNLDIALATEAKSFGFTFVEPQNDPNVGTAADSSFQVTLKNGTDIVGQVVFSRPVDTVSFFGVQSLVAFDWIEIREIAGGADHEFFGQFYTGSTAGLPEGNDAILTGSFSDTGANDTHTVYVDWGDNSPISAIPILEGQLFFEATHTYLDDIGPAGTTFDINDITVTVEDDDLGVSLPAVGNARITNVKPLVDILPGQGSTAGSILLATDLTDPGSGPTETFTYDWTISKTTFSGGNPQTQVIDSGAGSAADFTFIPQNGQLLATVTATDDDGGTDQDRAFVIVGTDLDDIITIAADGTVTIETSGNITTITVNPADADRYVVFGLDGDDSISGGASPLPLVVDGGNGTDIVTLSDGDDTAFLTSGDDVVDLGGGNNEAFLNPNSTLTVKAGTGDNTLNFSLADFGVELDMGQFDGTVQTVGIDSFDFSAQQSDNTLTAVGHIFAEGKKIRITGTGLPTPLVDGNEYFVVGLSGDTFQLSETKGGAPIDLTTDGSGMASLEHKVSVEGSFPTLVGTSQDDVITAGVARFDAASGVLSAGSTIISGDGSDTIFGRGLAGSFDLGDGDNLFIQTLDTSELAVIGGALDGANLAAIAGSFDIQIKGGIGNDRVVFGGLSGTFDLGEGDNVFIQTLDGNELASLTDALDADSLALAQSAFDGSELATIAGALDGADLAQVFGSLDLDVTFGEGLDRVFTNWASGTFDLGGGNDVFVQALDGRGLANLTGALDSADLAMLIQSLDVSVIAGAGADQVQTSLSGTFDLGIGDDVFIGSLDQAALAQLGGALDADDLASVAGQLDAAGLAALSGALDSADLVSLISSLDVNVFGGPGGDLVQTSLGGTFDLGSGDNLFVGSFDGVNLAQLGGALDSADIVSLVGTLDTADLAALSGALDGADLVTLIQSLDVQVTGGAGADQVRTSLTGTFDLGQGDNLFVGALDGFELASLGGALDGTDLAALTGALDSAALASLGGALDNAELASVVGALDVTFIGKSGNDQVQTSLPGTYRMGEGRNVFVGTLDTAELAALGGALDGDDLAALIGSLDSSGLAALIGSLDGSNLATLSGALDGTDLATFVGALDVNVFGGAGDDQVQSALGGEFRLGAGDNLFIGTLDGAGLASLTGALDGSDLAALIGALDGADLATLGAAVGADVDMLQPALSTGFDAAELVVLGGALDGTDLVTLIGSLDTAVFGGDGNDQIQTALSGTFDLGGGSNLFIGSLDSANLAALGGALDGQDLAMVLGSLDSNDLAALTGALDGAALAALGGALDSAQLVDVFGSLDIDYTGASGRDQVQTQLAGIYRLGDGANVFIGNFDAADLVRLGGALDGSDLATLTGALDGAELASLIGSLDSASLASLGGALDGTDLANVIMNLGVTVHGGSKADQVQSALKGEYNLADGDNLFLGTFDGPGLATLGGALDGPSLAYLIGALDGADLAMLAGALDGADLAALEGALDGNNLAALAGALDGTNLAQLGGALDGSELATIIGALDVTVNGGSDNDQVQTALPGIFNLADGENVFIGTLDGADIAQLAGALDSNDLVSVIGSLDSADLTALGGALDGPGLASLGGALDGGELAAFLQQELLVQYTSEGGNDQVESALPGSYTLGDGANLFIGTLDAANLANVGGALDSPELAALVGALDGADLVELINSLDGNGLAALGGALDGAELVDVLGALDITVTGGIGLDQVQTSLAGTFNLDGGDNVFVGTLDSASLASLGGALDGADLALLAGALDSTNLADLAEALDGADLALLTGALDGADLAALSGALDGQGLVALGGALDGDQLLQALESLQVVVVGQGGNDQVQSEMRGTYNLGTGNNLFIGTLDGPGLASLGGALDGADLIKLIGSLDNDDLAVVTGALDGTSLAALGGALDGAELATLIGSLDANLTTLGGNDQVQTALGGTYDLGNGQNLFLGNLDAANLAQLGGALDGNDLVVLTGALDSAGLADVIGSLDGGSLAALGGALDGSNLATLLGALDVTVTGGDDADQIQSGLTGTFALSGGDNLFIGTLDGFDLATLGGALDSAELATLTGALDAAGLAALTGALDGNSLATLTGALDADQLEAWLTNRGVAVYGLEGNDEVQTAIAGTYDLGAGSNLFFGLLDGPGLASLGGALDGPDLIALIGSLDNANLVQVGGALDGFGLAALGGALDGASLANLIGALDVDVTTTSGDDVVQSALAGEFKLGDGANVFVGTFDGPNLAALGGALDGADLSAIVGALDSAGLAALIGSLDGASLATVGGALDGQELATILGSLDVSVTGGTGKDQVQTSLDGSYMLGGGDNLFLGILDGPALAALGGALDSANLALLIGALDGADLSDALDGADLTAVTGALDGADLVGLAGALDGTALASLGGALDSQQLASILTTMNLYVSGGGNIDQVQTALPGTYELGAGENLFIGTLDGPGLAALSGALDDEDLATLIGSLDSTDIAQLGGALDGPALAELTGALDGVDLVSVLGALDVTVVTTGGDDQIQTQLAGSYELGDGENLYVGTFDGANLAQLSGALDSEDLAAILGSLDGNAIVALIGSLDGAGLATLSGALDGDQLRTVLESLHVSVKAGADKDQLQTALAGSFDLGDGDNLFIGSLDGAGLAALSGALDSDELVTLIGSLDGTDLVALGGAMDGLDLIGVLSQWSVDVTVGDGDDQVQTELGGIYNLGGANVDVQDADNRNLFIGVLNGAGFSQLAGALDGDDLVASIGSLDSQELAALGGALDSDQLLEFMQTLQITVNGGDNDDQVFTSLPGSYLTGGGSDLFIGNLDGAALAELSGQWDSAEVRAEAGSTDTSALVALGGALDSADLVALVASLEAFVNGGDNADRIESAMSGTFNLADGDDLFVGRLNKSALVQLGTVLDAIQLVSVVSDLNMHVIGGEGNDASRWGLSGVHDMGAGADSVSATLPIENIATLESVFNEADLASIVSAIDIDASGGEGADTFLVGTRGTYLGDAGTDRFIIGTQDATALGVQGDVQLDGGTGSDTFTFIGSNIGSVALTEDPEAGSDTSRDKLDFSGLQVGDTGISLDLELTTPQVLGAGILTLTLSNAAGVEDVVGTTGGDSILGNARPNVLVGALEDAHLPTEYAPRDSRVQFVLLDFDCFTNGEPTVEADGSFNCSVRDDLDEGEHVYTQVERDAIQGIMTRNYQGPDPTDPWLQFEFTQTVPVGGEYSIVYFNRTSPEVGGPGGLAEEIDFRNLNLTSRAFVQVNGILGEPDQPDDVSTNWITLSAKLASHELGHLAGLRHQDSFGPIGYGIHNPPGPDAYLPTYGGLAAAFETFDHLISSPASVGSTRFSDLNDLFFGERAAIKLSFNESGIVVDEDANAPHLQFEIDGVDHSAQDLGELPGLVVPNTLDRGIYANKEFVVAAVDVVGELDEVGQRDFYAFAGQAGDVITIEVMSFSLNRYEGQNIDPVVALYDSSGDLLTFMETESSAFNDDQFEAPDATIFDFVLPADDSYVFEVRAFTLIGTPEFDELCGAGGSREGSQACVGDTGKYEALVYRFQAVNSGDLGDTLDGRGGNDFLAGGSGFDILKGGDGADVLDSGPASDGDAPTLTASASQIGSATEGSPTTTTISFIDSSGETAGTVVVDYGDGSGPQQYSLTGGSVDITHTYSDNGTYTIEYTVTSDDGVTGSASMEITVENAVPAFDIVEDRSVAPGRVLELDTVTFSDPGFDYALGTAFETTETFEAEVDWGDGTVEPATVEVTPGGINVLTTGSVAASHIYAEMDVFTVTVRVRDDDMIAADTWVESTFLVTVKNTDPVLTVVGNQIVDQARPFAIEDVGTLTDDGETFTYSIDWGDGKIDTGTATVDTTGTTTSLTEASFDGQHTYGTAGTFQVIVTITDADGAVDSETFDVTSRKSLVVLDSEGKGALSLSGHAEVTIPGSVLVNSTSSQAISASGHAVITAAAIDVVGDVKASSNAELNPTPTTGTTAIVDPLAGLEAPTGLTDQGTFSCAGVGSHTISPGIYDQISASGSCQLVLQSGIYVIDNKKFKISGNAGVTVESGGVFIYMQKGSFDISGNGTFDLAPLDAGPYRGLLIAQAESNSKTIKLSGNARMSGVDGTIYAPNAQVSISGNGEIVAGIIAEKIRIDGNGVSSLLSDTEEDGGVSEGTVFSNGQLVMDELWVAISDPDNQLSTVAYQRVDSAIEDLNATFGPYGVNLIRVSGEDISLADFSVLIGETSPCGTFEDGVLGCTDMDGRITLISGWDWYEGESAAGITNSQYDLETIVMHELGHAVGLEHSIDVSSVMYSTLAAGEVKRSITDQDLEHLGGDGGGPESLLAAPPRASSGQVTDWGSAVDLFLSTSPDAILREPVDASTLSQRSANVVDGPDLPLAGNPAPQLHERLDRRRDQSSGNARIDRLEDDLESLDHYFTELAEFIQEEVKK